MFVPIAHPGCRRHTKESKSRSCDLVRRVGAADSATPHPDPSGGQAPRLALSSTALHFPIPAPWILACAGMTNGGPGTTSGGAVECGHTRCHVTSSRIGVRDMLSYQSLMPAGAGTRRYENRGLVAGRVSVSLVPPPPVLDSGPVPECGACFCAKDTMGSPCRRRWWYRGWRYFAGC